MSVSETHEIDAAADHALRVHVEKIVRPVQAEETRKLKMRRELRAHAVAAYEDEIRRRLTPEAAVRRAIERIGEPDEITSELQAGVPWSSRSTAWIDVLTRRRPGVPRWRHAIWFGALEGGGLLLFLLLAIWPIQAIDLTEVGGRVAAWFTVTLALMFGVNASLGTWFGAHIREHIASDGGSWRSFRMAALIGMAAAAMMFSTGFVFVAALMLPRPDLGVFDLLQWGKFYAAWAALSALFAPAAVVLSWLDVRERAGLEQWLALQID